MKKIFLAGATGSIGKNVFYCIKSLNQYYEQSLQKHKKIHITGIVIRNNTKILLNCFKELKKQDQSFQPPKVMVSTNPITVSHLRKIFPKSKIFSSISEAVESTSFDLMVNGLSGSIGLLATVPALKKGKKILLANKESLVMAGKIINRLIKKNKAELIPIDSEHSAIYQLLKHYQPHQISRLILTASGGPFLKNHKKNPTVVEALKHPNWKMGEKITIDSATMMNKGLEVIEAHHLFGFSYEQIEVIIHPQSLVHSMIETIDGVQYAQLGSTDMRHPIFSAISHPETIPHRLKQFNLFNYKDLNFYKPNFRKFPMLSLAYDCGKKEVQSGNNHCVVMNAANEKAVELFLEKQISFSQIYSLTRSMVEKYEKKKLTRINQIEDIIKLDEETKNKTQETAKNRLK